MPRIAAAAAPQLRPFGNDASDALGRAPVAVGQRRAAHARELQRVREQAADGGDDARLVGPDQRVVTARDRFRPLGALAQQQQRHAEQRRFFLHPPGIGKDQIGVEHRSQHCIMAAWRLKRDVRSCAEEFLHRRSHARVRVQDDEDADAAFAGDLAQRRGDRRQALAPAFPAMTGDQQALDSPVTHLCPANRPRQRRVDAGVAGDMDRAGDFLAPEVGGA